MSNDSTTYSPLRKDPTVEYKKTLKNLIKNRYKQGILNKKEKDYLIPSAPQTPIILYIFSLKFINIH